MSRELVFDVREYGAVADSVVGTPRTDNVAAFQNALNAAAAAKLRGAAVRVVVPPASGYYRLSGPVEARNVRITGDVGAFYGHGNTKLLLDPKVRAAFKVLNAFQSSDGSDAEGCDLSGFDVQCTPSNSETTFTLGATVTAGQLLVADAYHARYLVVVGGTLDGSTYPSIRDVAHVPDPTYPYAQGMPVHLGRLVRASTPSLWTLQFQALGIAPGVTVTAGAEPSWNTTVGQTTTGADGIVWTTQVNDSFVQSGSAILENVQYGAFEATTRCRVSDCVIRGPQTNGWRVYGSAPTIYGSDCTGTRFDRVRTILATGQYATGCYTRGGSLRGCLFQQIFVTGTAGQGIGNLSFSASASSWPSQGECGIVAEGYTTGSAWLGCFVQYCQGLDYWAASGASMDQCIACVTDGGRVRLDGNALWVGGSSFGFHDSGGGIRPVGGTGQASASTGGLATPYAGSPSSANFGPILIP